MIYDKLKMGSNVVAKGGAAEATCLRAYLP